MSTATERCSSEPRTEASWRVRVGDYAMPSGDGHWHCVDNAQAVPELQRFADALDESGPKWPGLARFARQRLLPAA